MGVMLQQPVLYVPGNLHWNSDFTINLELILEMISIFVCLPPSVPPAIPLFPRSHVQDVTILPSKELRCVF